jgi:enamine deaminase RidA (YjgF/YER057c/UK114 family)
MKTAIAAWAALSAASTPTSENARHWDAIVPPDHQAWTDEYHFSAAVRANGFIFVSGVVASTREDETGEAGLEAAYERAFARIAEILRAAGASWDDVVDMTTYHVDAPAQFDAIRRVKDRYVKGPYPAWTAIDVDRLLPKNGVTEIKVVAVAPNKPAPTTSKGNP